jgi:hypothetical protein
MRTVKKKVNNLVNKIISDLNLSKKLSNASNMPERRLMIENYVFINLEDFGLTFNDYENPGLVNMLFYRLEKLSGYDYGINSRHKMIPT